MTSTSAAIAAFMVASFLAGAIGQYVYPGQLMPASDLWLMPLFVFLIFAWYRLDSEKRGYPRTKWLNIAIVAIALLALPYYLIRSRGWKRGLVATAIMLLYLVISGIAGAAGQYAVYYGLQA